ncbi:MAG: imidazolonepropionase, partial [Flavobacteriaceae bacterium]
MSEKTLIGPFKQIVPMTGLPLKGAIADHELMVLEDGGILVKAGKIVALGNFTSLSKDSKGVLVHRLQGEHVALPGLVDAHTHICFAGSRANDYAMRNAGKTYLEIAKAGGGIWDTVVQTRKASQEALVKGIVKRANRHLKNGVTTLEVKSGYGLSVEEELKMLHAIKQAKEVLAIELIPTCLAAHMLPKDYSGSAANYLDEISSVLFPKLKEEGLAHRIDAFIEQSAFDRTQIGPYFLKAQAMG